MNFIRFRRLLGQPSWIVSQLSGRRDALDDLSASENAALRSSPAIDEYQVYFNPENASETAKYGTHGNPGSCWRPEIQRKNDR
jgi:hypothetical protein